MTEQPDQAPPTDDGFVRAELLYLGRAVLTSGKKAARYIPLAKLGNRPASEITAALFSGKGTDGRTVGGVYEAMVKLDENGQLESVRFSSLRFLRRLNDARVAEWELMNDALVADERAASTERKIKNDKALAGEMGMLRRMYRHATPSLRPAIELAVLKALRS